MTHNADGVREYQSMTRKLLVKRALGLLTLDDQAEIAEDLDAIWRQLSEDQQRELEEWLKLELQPPPKPEIHQAVIDVGFEANDVTVAPRSAA